MTISLEAVQAALDAHKKHIDKCEVYLASEGMQAALEAAFPIMLRDNPDWMVEMNRNLKFGNDMMDSGNEGGSTP